MPDAIWRWGPVLFCLLLSAIATAVDLRSYRIPNAISFAGIALGVLVQPILFGIDQGSFEAARSIFLGSVLGLLLLGVTFSALGFAGFIGMGDAKLMAAIGAVLGWRDGMWATAYVLIAGGVVSLAYALQRGALGGVLSNLKSSSKLKERERLHRLPYALAIFLGLAWMLIGHFFPSFSLSF